MDLKNAGIIEKEISIVAPSYITNQLLNAEYNIIEFVNSPIKREKMVFCCEGCYIYRLICIPRDVQTNDWIAYISQKYIECPMSIEEQVESSLVPEKSKDSLN